MINRSICNQKCFMPLVLALRRHKQKIDASKVAWSTQGLSGIYRDSKVLHLWDDGNLIVMGDLDVFTCTLLSNFVSVFIVGIGLSLYFLLKFFFFSFRYQCNVGCIKNYLEAFLHFVFYRIIWESIVLALHEILP